MVNLAPFSGFKKPTVECNMKSAARLGPYVCDFCVPGEYIWDPNYVTSIDF